MARLTPRFSANRAVRDYVEGFYLPAAAAYRGRSANAAATARTQQAWQATLSTQWSQLRFGQLRTDVVPDGVRISAEVFLGRVCPDAIQVQLYADPGGGQPSATLPMMHTPGTGAGAACLFTATIPANRPAADYTPRIIPAWQGAQIPLELPLIAWRTH